MACLPAYCCRSRNKARLLPFSVCIGFGCAAGVEADETVNNDCVTCPAPSRSEIISAQVTARKNSGVVENPRLDTFSRMDIGMPRVYLGQQCPLASLDAAVVSGTKSKQLLHHLIRSFDLFLPCFGAFHVLVPKTEAKSLMTLSWPLGALRGTHIHSIDLPESILRQRTVASHLNAMPLFQYLVLSLDLFGNAAAEHIAIFDSDQVLGAPVTCGMLFQADSGLPWSYYYPPLDHNAFQLLYKSVGRDTQKDLSGTEFHIQYADTLNVIRLLFGDVPEPWIGDFGVWWPQVFPRDIFALARKRFEKLQSCSWNYCLEHFHCKTCVTFEDIFVYVQQMFDFDAYTVLAHVAVHDVPGKLALVPCFGRGAAKDTTCQLHAHAAVHVPYFQNCWALREDFVNPLKKRVIDLCHHTMQGIQKGSPEYVAEVEEILHRGICFSWLHYGSKVQRTATEMAQVCGAKRRSEWPHNRLFSYLIPQRIRLRNNSAEFLQWSGVLELDRHRRTC